MSLVKIDHIDIHSRSLHYIDGEMVNKYSVRIGTRHFRILATKLVKDQRNNYYIDESDIPDDAIIIEFED